MRILKLLSTVSLVVWVATFGVSVSTWGSKVDTPIQKASQAEHVGEAADQLMIATNNAVELSGLRNFSNPEFIRWLSLVSSTRASARLADSSSAPPEQVMGALQRADSLAEYEMPPFGVSLPGNPWLFWGWGFVSLLVLTVSTLAGLFKASQVYEPSPTARQASW